MTTAAGSANSDAMRAAASTSSRFVNESSFPWRTAGRSAAGTSAGTYHPAGWCGFSPYLQRPVPVRLDTSLAGSSSRSVTRTHALLTDGHGLEFPRDGRVVAGRVRERLPGQPEPDLHRRAARLVERGEHAVVVGRRGDDEHVLEVLRGGTDHRRPADVDVLDQGLERRGGLRGRLAEGVEIDDHEVDGRDAVAREGLEVAGVIAAREDAAVHERMQRLDAAVHHLGRAGDLRHLEHGKPGPGEGLCRAAGGHDLDAARDQAARELDEAALVGHADQCTHDDSRGMWRTRAGVARPPQSISRSGALTLRKVGR